jgi:transcription-repair coupling factor (superfamily II helicase)
VLTPTTVLSFQHYETFKQRFKQFPINVEMISRFRTPKEQKLILERVESGKIDILIGTHRLLSKDIKFQDLGLLVVDEEQRFGVRHKERLKQGSPRDRRAGDVGDTIREPCICRWWAAPERD